MDNVTRTTKSYRPRLTHAVIVKAPGLLPMLYTLSELKQELGVPPRTLQDWLAHGVPHHRDATGHPWVNGRDLADWVQQARAAQKPPTLAVGHAYCLRCRQGTLIANPITVQRGKLMLLHGTCSKCGGLVNRGQ